jgi:hypothetical protein
MDFLPSFQVAPIFIVERFLALNGIKSGPCFLRMDQGGELWRSNELREAASAEGYAIESTGSDAASKNNNLYQPNGTVGVMVQCLLYSAGLSAIFWSAILVHAVYLKNLTYHKALCMTPREAWTDVKPALAHLHTFDDLIMARKPGKRPANADRHTAHGVLLDFGVTTKQVHYFDQTSNREKLSIHNTIYEANYSKT